MIIKANSLNNAATKYLAPGTEFAKKLWGEISYCLHSDYGTMFTQPQCDLFVKLAKLGAHYYKIDIFW